jgi:hypothetical protein
MGEDRIELEAAEGEFRPEHDRRVRMEEPLPVRLVAVGDVRVPGRTGMEGELQRFYVGMWGFGPAMGGEGEVAFWAENFRLVLEMREGLIEREDLRPVGVEVRSLAEAEQKLIDAEMEYQRQRGVQVGSESILVQDPAGNWVELTERREIG